MRNYFQNTRTESAGDLQSYGNANIITLQWILKSTDYGLDKNTESWNEILYDPWRTAAK
jgi:hypothetical protein